VYLYIYIYIYIYKEKMLAWATGNRIKSRTDKVFK
jgi:hypothetical protein